MTEAANQNTKPKKVKKEKKKGRWKKGRWTRRGFIGAGLLAGGALVVGVAIRPGDRTGELAKYVTDEGEHLVTAWVKISEDNTITASTPRSRLWSPKKWTLIGARSKSWRPQLKKNSLISRLHVSL